jgi:potassium/chloride transporter 9
MSHDAPPRRQALLRSHSNFAARTAVDNDRQLERRWSLFPSSPSPRDENPNLDGAGNPLLGTPDREAGVGTATIPLRLQSFGTFLGFGSPDDNRHGHSSTPQKTSRNGSVAGEQSRHGDKRHSHDHGIPRARSISKAPGSASAKLGTFAGVFVPTTLNVLSILMFLRFGFILGQSGVVGMMGMLIACYAINLLTTMSVSAIATNGTVRGGGAYYLISRSLGPEFGGSIGIIFYIGCVFNTGMNAVGMIDCLTYNFGATNGGWAQWLPVGFWWGYLWATMALVVCTAICLAGSSLFARASNGLLVILLIATFSIPLSTLFVRPWESRKLGIEYTGLSMETFNGNLMPRFTKGADGSQLSGRETWRDLFGILFPATGGIFALVPVVFRHSPNMANPTLQWCEYVWRLEASKQSHSERYSIWACFNLCVIHRCDPRAGGHCYQSLFLSQCQCYPRCKLLKPTPLTKSTNNVGQHVWHRGSHGRICNFIFLRFDGCHWLR